LAPEALTVTRKLVLTRWHLELFLGNVERVVGEPLEPGAKPEPLPTMSAPATDAEARDNVTLAMRAYDRTQRHAGDLWGRRKSTALGVRIADRAARAATPDVPLMRGSLQLIVSAILVFTVDALLLRGAFLVSGALLVNIVLVPRLDQPLRIFVVIVWMVLSGIYWAVFVRRRTRVKWRGIVALVFAAVPTAFGIASIWCQGWVFRSVRRKGGSPFDLLVSGDSRLRWSVAVVGVSSALATALLWLWAKRRWMLPMAALAGLTMAWWVVVSGWEYEGDPGFWLSVQARAGSMWVAAALLSLVATVIALKCSPEDR